MNRVIVSDTTTESLAITLNDNPRGVAMIRPELTALMSSMNQYKGGRGQDRQVYLSLWDGETAIIDRKTDKDREGVPLYIQEGFVSIVGGLQPDVLRQLRGETVRGAPPPDDGWLDRFVIAFPQALPAVGETWREVSEESLTAWDQTVRGLLDLEMVADPFGGRPRPALLSLAPDGKRAWDEFTQGHAAEVNHPDFPDHLRGPWAKLKGYCARVALVLHLLRVVNEDVAEEVSGESIRRAARLVAYFKAHRRKVHAAMDADPKVAAARKVLRWVLAGRLTRFSKRDAYQALKGTFKKVEELDGVLSVLEKHHIIRPEPPPARQGAGRKPSPFYEVNPQVTESDSGDSGDNGGGDALESSPSLPAAGATGPPTRRPSVEWVRRWLTHNP